MLVKLYITISETEHQAIQKLAEKELRPFREQVRVLLRNELLHLGLLPDEVLGKVSPLPASSNQNVAP